MSWKICERCEGDETIVNPAFDYMTASEVNEMGPEFTENYLDGVYDVECPDCSGTGKVHLR